MDREIVLSGKFIERNNPYMEYFIIPEKMSFKESIDYINSLDMTINKTYKVKEEDLILYQIKGESETSSEISLELRINQEYKELKVLDKVHLTVSSKLKRFGKVKNISIYTEFGVLNFKAKIRR